MLKAMLTFVCLMEGRTVHMSQINLTGSFVFEIPLDYLGI
jgi:hypothetical protein